MYWGPDGWGWGGWFVMIFSMVAFWALVIAVVVWLVRGARYPQGRDEAVGRSSALAILEERFARGEIDRDEFEQRRAALRGH